MCFKGVGEGNDAVTLGCGGGLRVYFKLMYIYTKKKFFPWPLFKKEFCKHKIKYSRNQEIFNKYFVTIGQKLAQALAEMALSETNYFLSKRMLVSHLLASLTEFVLNNLKLLKVKKAIGLDKISTRMLKDAAEIIAPVLQILINL